MTMTPERLAELDAVMAKANFTRLAAEYIPPNDHVEDGWRIHDFPPNSQVALCLAEGIDEEHAAAIVALHNAYADLRAHIDAQAATIARVIGAAKSLLALCEQAGLADDLLATIYPDSKNRSGQTRDETAKQARRTMNEARAAIAKIGANQ